MIHRLAVVLLFALLLAPPVVANDRPCGVGAGCKVESGDYLLAFPEAWNGTDPLPAVLFFHGHASSAEAVLKSEVPDDFGKAGYLVIAPNGAILPRRDIRAWPGRRLPPGRRDDVRFVMDVMDDVASRVPLDRDRVLVSGFSAGGSMVWLLACTQGQQFAAFAAVSGALRQPMPVAGCTGGPVRMLHVHGFSDTQVPLEGRRIRNWHQGSVFAALDRQREVNGCRSEPSRIELGEPFRCRIWQGCASGREIRFCLHDDGHRVPDGWAQLAIDWFENGSSNETH